MLVYEALNHIVNNISNIYSFQESSSIAKIALKNILNTDSLGLSLSINDELSNNQYETLLTIIDKLKKYTPIQYIIGKTSFLDLEIKVNENVLIPRPETEELVTWLINDIEKTRLSDKIKILDIGTGSGCIAIAIKSILSNSEVYACDISEKALELAKENAIKHNLNIEFFISDILADSFQSALQTKEFDIIISNPPYVLESEKKFMRKNVLDYEPETALFVKDSDPLIFYKRIASIAGKTLSKNGFLYLEINENFSDGIKTILNDYYFNSIIVKQDFLEKKRMVRGSLL